VTGTVDENVRRLDVTVQNAFIAPMTVSQGKRNFGKGQPDLVLADHFAVSASARDHSLEIAPWAILHDNVDFLFFPFHKAVNVLHNVRIVQLAKYIHLIDQKLFLTAAHRAEVNLLDGNNVAIMLV
jgi:hypothetical protein